jgi:uncharacterized protein (TIGR00269 family)
MNKQFINQFENKVKNTIEKFNLISEDDKIVVACSGGKDSTVVLHILKKLGYSVEALTVDLLIGEWSKKNLDNLKKFCKDNEIKLHEINIRKELGYSICYIRSTIQSKTNLNNCMICGVMKRWLINKEARKLGATKLVTGHNMDDEAQTIFMNIINGNPKLSLYLGPRSGVRDKKFTERIKPLYLCSEEEVTQYSKMMNFPVLYKPCPCSLNSFRRKIKNILDDYETKNHDAKHNIVTTFLEIKPRLKKLYKDEKVIYCKKCNEPSRKDLCKVCGLMSIVQN